MEQVYTSYDGLKLPKIGFGTYQLWGRAGVDAMVSAIQQGYRLLDTAYNYENEGTVGEAIRRSGIDRGQLMVTSKLPGRYQRADKVWGAIQESLYRCQLDYFDLYLIHWPLPKQNLYVEAWQRLIEAKEMGLVKAIGVCNFLPEHIDRLQQMTGVLPSVNQIELHPYFNQAAQRAYDAEKGIITQAWSPLGRASNVLNDRTLGKIAAHHQRSISQIILRWQLQLGVLPIPKSANPERQKENLAVYDFVLSALEMDEINALSHDDGRLQGQDPATYEEF